MMEKEQQVRVTPTERLILSSLLKGELYGLQIAKSVMTATEGKRVLTRGTIYPTLKILEEKKKLVISRWGDEGQWDKTEQTRKGARRRYYQLSRLGESVLKATEE